MSLTINPYATTSIANGFSLDQSGYMQGLALMDPVELLQLEGGLVASTVTTPIWGAVPVTLALPTTVGGTPTGPTATLATSVANTHAWAVVNQATAGVISAGNPVPLYGANMSFNFVRVGSRVRVPIKVDPTIVSAILGGSPVAQVLYDYTNQQIIAYTSGTALPVQILAVSTNSKTISYNSGTGIASYSETGSVLLCQV